MIKTNLWIPVAFTAILASCSSTKTAKVGSSKSPSRVNAKDELVVRTTAYTHTESDHIKYGNKSATGDALKYGGLTRSAAADWSVYPLGTVFKIKGEPFTYEVDDYGSALVGTKTIDIYKPSRGEMNDWGVRNVNIEVVQWGSKEESLKTLIPRSKYSHIRQMIGGLVNNDKPLAKPIASRAPTASTYVSNTSTIQHLPKSQAIPASQYYTPQYNSYRPQEKKTPASINWSTPREPSFMMDRSSSTFPDPEV